MTIRGDQELVTRAVKEFERLKVDAQDNTYAEDALRETLQAPDDKITEAPSSWPGGFTYTEDASREGRESSTRLEEMVAYYRAKALDEGKGIPTKSDVLQELVRRASRDLEKRRVGSKQY
jgi:hypothetical protein